MRRGVPERAHRLLERLGDVKTMALNPSNYSSGQLNGGVRGRCITTRASKVNTDVKAQARKLDDTYSNVQPGTNGPVFNKIQSYGEVQGLCFGAFGEVSQDVRNLLIYVSKRAATVHWKDMGARDEERAMAALRMRWKRKLAVANVREHHRLKLTRLSTCVKGAQAGFHFTQDKENEHQERQRCYEESEGFTRQRQSRFSCTNERRR